MLAPALARPSISAELAEAAIQISRLLRDSKVDAPLRPKAFTALVLAAAYGGWENKDKDKDKDDDGGARALARIDQRVAAALRSLALPPGQRRLLQDLLRLSGPEFRHLPFHLPALGDVLSRLDLASMLRAEFDFLGIFYEAFLRYGFDNNALGIVFTPRHITRFCVDLLGVGPEDRVIDVACGTGGFLVPAYERLLAVAGTCRS